MRLSTRRWALLGAGASGAVSIAVAALILDQSHRAVAQAVAAPLPTVVVSPPLQQQVTGWDTFTGRLDAVDTVAVRPRVSGSIQSVAFRDGDYVHRGDLLFIIDPRPYQAAVTEAEGQLAQAQTQLAFAIKDLNRGRSLVTTQTISASVFEQRQQKQEEASAAVLTANGVLDRARLDLEFTHVVAPIDGLISRKLVSEGNLVGGGDASATLLTTVVSLDTIDAYFDIDEESFLRYRQHASRHGAAVELGGEVKVALPNDATPGFSGTLNFAENRLDASTGTLRLRARIANPDHTLRPGQFVRVSMVADAPHDAMLVPDSAITSDASRRALYVVGPDDRVTVRPVVLGRLFGTMREITGGLGPADRVIVSGLQRVQPGARVAVQIETIKQKRVASLGDIR